MPTHNRTKSIRQAARSLLFKIQKKDPVIARKKMLFEKGPLVRSSRLPGVVGHEVKLLFAIRMNIDRKALRMLTQSSLFNKLHRNASRELNQLRVIATRFGKLPLKYYTDGKPDINRLPVKWRRLNHRRIIIEGNLKHIVEMLEKEYAIIRKEVMINHLAEWTLVQMNYPRSKQAKVMKGIQDAVNSKLWDGYWELFAKKVHQVFPTSADAELFLHHFPDVNYSLSRSNIGYREEIRELLEKEK